MSLELLIYLLSWILVDFCILVVTTSDSQDPSQPPRSIVTKQSTMDCCPTFDNFDFDMVSIALHFVRGFNVVVWDCPVSIRLPSYS